ncbi:SLOG family protein [Rhizobium alvei]|uniref:SLOG family protein n=1 Tax=Rhizobium alvei TaxID=1132659 RepID=A0ABT8YTE2_9HYPH|nr:SLOG family protein [Rhizobium alvei]MDO6967009.1 SLOG family protein [Rhizobium alvei]
MTKVLVCGGRHFGVYPPAATDDKRKRVRAEMRLANETLDCIHVDRKITRIINGGASGADTLARAWAERKMVSCLTEIADWSKYGKAAGPMRNQKMLDEYKPDLVVAFPGGRGTADMVSRARVAGVEVIEASL